MRISRRRFVVSGAGIVAAAFGAARPGARQKFEITRTDAEWQKLLTRDQYLVLRKDYTEPPFSSPLNNEKRAGVFACAGCGLDVFASTTKFESGTGWPSFWAPIEKSVGKKRDLTENMDRTAVFCRRCGGHLGHVFDDGPKPTFERYCINGLALTFKPAASRP